MISNLKSLFSNLKSTSAVAIQAPDRIGGTHKNLDIRENPPDSSVESNHVRSIAHNTIAGAGFGDCPLGANIIGEPAPTGIGVIDRT